MAVKPLSRKLLNVSYSPISYAHIDRYHRELAHLIEFGGSANEENVRPAVQNCLAAYYADHKERLNQSQGGMCICRVLGIGAGVSRECFGP